MVLILDKFQVTLNVEESEVYIFNFELPPAWYWQGLRLLLSPKALRFDEGGKEEAGGEDGDVVDEDGEQKHAEAGVVEEAMGYLRHLPSSICPL